MIRSKVVSRTKKEIEDRFEEFFKECKHDGDGNRLLYRMLIPESKRIIIHSRQSLVELITEWVHLTQSDIGEYPSRTNYALDIAEELQLTEMESELRRLRIRLEKLADYAPPDKPWLKDRIRSLLEDIDKVLALVRGNPGQDV